MNLQSVKNETNLGILAISNLIKKFNRSDVNTFTSTLKRLYICFICSSLFVKKNNLNKHVSEKYNFIQSFYCNICQQKFKRNNYLSKHQAIHIKNFNIVFSKIIVELKDYVLSTKLYFRYLTNSTI